MRNPLAQKHLRTIRKGDRIFYYHTGKEKAVVAIARALATPTPIQSTAPASRTWWTSPLKRSSRGRLAAIKADRDASGCRDSR